MKFFVGLHKPNQAANVHLACISNNRLRDRKGAFVEPVEGWMLDSGAFTEITKHGKYRSTAQEYAEQAARWATPKLKVVVAQDYMCEPFVLKKTGLTVREHQRLTVERFDDLCFWWNLEKIKRGSPAWWPPIMPVLQGWTVDDYLQHIRMYGDRLTLGMWVGVGSVCKRQGTVETIEFILSAIKGLRPDLLLHGFGVKLTALRSKIVQFLLHTADSMAWSFAAKARAHVIIRELQRKPGEN